MIATALALVGIGAAMVWANTQNRPTALSAGIHTHEADPAALHVRINDLVFVDSTLEGRNVTDGIPYSAALGDDLEVKLWWFNLDSRTHYTASVTLDARSLSTFGEDGTHAALDITVGPGADVEVTTPHPEGLRLVGLNRMDEITPDMDVPVVLAKLCGTVQDGDTSPEGILMRAAGDEGSLAYAAERKENAIRHSGAPVSRCAGQ